MWLVSLGTYHEIIGLALKRFTNTGNSTKEFFFARSLEILSSRVSGKAL
jgi:hypothetical protein